MWAIILGILGAGIAISASGTRTAGTRSPGIDGVKFSGITAEPEPEPEPEPDDAPVPYIRRTERGEGGLIRGMAGTYDVYWREGPTWLAQSDHEIQYRKHGDIKSVSIDWPDVDPAVGKRWVDAMATATTGGPAAYRTKIKQKLIVAPWPPLSIGPYNCRFLAPGPDLIKNIACGVRRDQRDDVTVETYANGGDGWYVASWPWGPLFAARTSPEAVHQAGLAVAEQINGRGLTGIVL